MPARFSRSCRLLAEIARAAPVMTRSGRSARSATSQPRTTDTYQPGGRYWPLQWYELGVFLAGALLLAAACRWRIRRIG